MSLSKEDILFGKIAVLNNIINQQQLDEAITIQQSKNYFCPIAIILYRKKYISKQHLQNILETQKKRLPRPAISPQEKRDDLIFAYFTEKLQFTNLAAIYDALSLQTQMVKRGLLLRLFEVLINQGYLLPEQAEHILNLQEKAMIVCLSCGTKHNTLGIQKKFFPCKKCGSELDIPDDVFGLYDLNEIELLHRKLDEMAKQETLILLQADLAPLHNKKKISELPADDGHHFTYGVLDTSDEDVMEELLGEPIHEPDFITVGEGSTKCLEEHKYTDEWYWSRDIISDLGGETSDADQGNDTIADEDIIDMDQLLRKQRKKNPNPKTQHIQLDQISWSSHEEPQEEPNFLPHNPHSIKEKK